MHLYVYMYICICMMYIYKKSRYVYKSSAPPAPMILVYVVYLMIYDSGQVTPRLLRIVCDLPRDLFQPTNPASIHAKFLVDRYL